MSDVKEQSRPVFERRDLILIIALAVGLLLVSMVRLSVGSVEGWPDWQTIEYRLDNVVIALTAGAALATAGALLQALLRNPLASPYIIGVSSGAALGRVIVWAGGLTILGAAAAPTAAVGGALVTLVIIYALSQKRGWVDPLGLLLVGVIVNAINGAIIMFIHYFDPMGLGVELNRWMLGYFNMNDPRWQLYSVAAVVLPGVVLSTWLGRSIDVATFSDSEAQALGVNLGRLRLGMFAVAGVLTAAAVLLAGPIGFVGLICPHWVRLVIGPRHTPLIVASALAGGLLLVGGDLLLQVTDVGQGKMPVGIVMALVGGPVFLWMLRGQLGRGGGA